jgi:hypothetical protein
MQGPGRGHSGCGEATRERDRLLLAGVGTRTASIAISAGFDAARDRRLRVGVASDLSSACADIGTTVGVTAGIACGVGFRPRPSSLAMVDRRSE